MNKPDKTLTLSGAVEVKVEGNRLIIEASGGLTAAMAADARGQVLWMWHPLSGWYVEADMRKGVGEDEEGQPWEYPEGKND